METFVVRVKGNNVDAIDYTVQTADGALVATETAEKWFRADFKRSYGLRYAGGLTIQVIEIDGVRTHEAEKENA